MAAPQELPSEELEQQAKLTELKAFLKDKNLGVFEQWSDKKIDLDRLPFFILDEILSQAKKIAENNELGYPEAAFFSNSKLGRKDDGQIDYLSEHIDWMVTNLDTVKTSQD